MPEKNTYNWWRDQMNSHRDPRDINCTGVNSDDCLWKKWLMQKALEVLGPDAHMGCRGDIPYHWAAEFKDYCREMIQKGEGFHDAVEQEEKEVREALTDPYSGKAPSVDREPKVNPGIGGEAARGFIIKDIEKLIVDLEMIGILLKLKNLTETNGFHHIDTMILKSRHKLLEGILGVTVYSYIEKDPELTKLADASNGVGFRSGGEVWFMIPKNDPRRSEFLKLYDEVFPGGKRKEKPNEKAANLGEEETGEQRVDGKGEPDSSV